jgi:hypothetical protein
VPIPARRRGRHDDGSGRRQSSCPMTPPELLAAAMRTGARPSCWALIFCRLPKSTFEAASVPVSAVPSQAGSRRRDRGRRHGRMRGRVSRRRRSTRSRSHSRRPVGHPRDDVSIIISKTTAYAARRANAQPGCPCLADETHHRVQAHGGNAVRIQPADSGPSASHEDVRMRSASLAPTKCR